jgi:hypothetical protein
MMTDAEIAVHMNWRHSSDDTQHEMKKIKALLAIAVQNEREACARVCENHPKWALITSKVFIYCAKKIRNRLQHEQ